MKSSRFDGNPPDGSPSPPSKVWPIRLAPICIDAGGVPPHQRPACGSHTPAYHECRRFSPRIHPNPTEGECSAVGLQATSAVANATGYQEHVAFGASSSGAGRHAKPCWSFNHERHTGIGLIDSPKGDRVVSSSLSRVLCRRYQAALLANGLVSAFPPHAHSNQSRLSTANAAAAMPASSAISASTALTCLADNVGGPGRWAWVRV